MSESDTFYFVVRIHAIYAEYCRMVYHHAKEDAIMTEQERIAEFRRLEASINPLDLREYLLALRDSACTAGPPPADQEAASGK